MNNTRFATAIHILAILAKFPEKWLSSDWIAESININPVIVRKELGTLHAHRWIVSRKGKVGGTKLQVPPESITLAEIYKAVKNTDVLGKKNLKTNPSCPIGRNINNNLESLFIQTDSVVIASLENKTLKKFVEQFS